MRSSTDNKIRSNQGGFTLVELMIAMAVFSFVMVMVSIGIIQVMKIYQSNLATRRTQQAARVVIEDITREIRTADKIVIANDGHLCLEGTSIVAYDRVNDGSLVKRAIKGSCSHETGVSVNTQLIGPSATPGGVSVSRFVASPVGPTGRYDSAKIFISVVTGPQEIVATNGTACQPGAGSQYCAAASYTITITPRKGEQ